ncbi:hypothetical protein Tco_1508321 [Tanacetum coccineum]
MTLHSGTIPSVLRNQFSILSDKDEDDNLTVQTIDDTQHPANGIARRGKEPLKENPKFEHGIGAEVLTVQCK